MSYEQGRQLARTSLNTRFATYPGFEWEKWRNFVVTDHTFLPDDQTRLGYVDEALTLFNRARERAGLPLLLSEPTKLAS